MFGKKTIAQTERNGRLKEEKTVQEQIIALHRQYGGLVRRRAQMLLGSQDAAEDAAQEVFMRVIKHVDTFRSEASPVTWLYRITTNHCLDELRKRARRGVTSLTPELEQTLTQKSSSAEQRAASKQLLNQLMQSSDRTSVQILLHRYLDDMTQEEIAKMMGINRKTVWNKLDRLRKQLEKQQ